jgi:hypothetical protein
MKAMGRFLTSLWSWCDTNKVGKMTDSCHCQDGRVELPLHVFSPSRPHLCGVSLRRSMHRFRINIIINLSHPWMVATVM